MAVAQRGDTNSLTTDRIVLFTELFPPAVGGSAILFHGIYSRLRESEVIVLADGLATSSAEPADATSLRMVRRRFGSRRWGLLDPTACWQHVRLGTHLRRLARNGRTVVHCGRALPEGVAAWLGRVTGGPRYVCWAHGEDLATALTSREFTYLTKMVYRWADAAVANSMNTARMLGELGVPDSKITIVYPGVDADRFHPRVDGRQLRRRFAHDGDVLLLSVGRLQRRKGHDVSIQAIAALKDKLPNLRYLIVGDGDERTRLEQLSAEHNVHDRVFFAGTVPDCDLPEYYAACDIFLLPNRIDHGDIEGFGIVFLEAAAAGKPVIGGSSGGVPEAVERNVTGLLVDGSDVSSVAAAILDLATSQERRRRMGLAGRARVLGRFSWQRAAAAVSALQRRLVAGA